MSEQIRQKRAYHAPQFRAFGTVKEITATDASAPFQDGPGDSYGNIDVS